ncbi:tumor necrosis factor receptor superfamily member 12A-like isoform X2 [Mustelus asterias]
MGDRGLQFLVCVLLVSACPSIQQLQAQLHEATSGTGALNAAMGCPLGQVWNADLDKCLDCGICTVFPRTPSCSKCSVVHTTLGPAGKRSEIMTLQTLTFIIVGIAGGFVILSITLGIVLRRNVKKTTFSKPIEESGEGMSPGFLLL